MRGSGTYQGRRSGVDELVRRRRDVGRGVDEMVNPEITQMSQNNQCNLRMAVIFPGQGSQSPGMGKELFEKFAVARQVFEEADDALGFSISRLCFDGPEADLQLTENTQPAILTVSIAVFRVMTDAGIRRPAFVAGHSLGEYSALVAAGALKLTDAVRTVRARGRYMQEAVPVGTGAMAAIIGGDLGAIQRICS